MLTEFFERTTEPMCITTVAGQFLLVNAAFGRLLGYSPKEIFRVPVKDIYALPSERRRFRGTIEGNGRAHGVSLTLKTRGGATVQSTVDATVWHLTDGSIGGYIGLVHSEHRQLPIGREMEVFDLALEGANEGLWNWDLRTEEVRYSNRWKAILGYDDLEIHNSLSEWTSRIHPSDLEGFRDSLRAHLKRERDVFLCHFRMTHKDGAHRWMLVRGVAEFGTDGKARRIAGSLSNVSAHMQVIERLKQEGSLLEEKSRNVEAQRDAFARYLPEELRLELVDRGEEQIRPRNSEATVLYIKIEEAAFYHSHISAERFSVFINELLSDISDLIHGRRGIVARTEGDSVVALFGILARHADDVDRAFAAADSVHRYVRTYNDVRNIEEGPNITLSIGISYGMIFTGTTGNVHRMEFTCYGLPIRRAQILQARASIGKYPVLADRNAAGRASLSWCMKQVKVPTADGYSLAFTMNEVSDPQENKGCIDSS